MPQVTLLSELRRRIRDVRYSTRAMSVALKEGSGATSAFVEVTNRHFILTAAGGTTKTIDLPLCLPRYETIGQLFQILSRTPWLAVQADEDFNQDHVSADLESFSATDIREVGVDLKHHIFSDSELEQILRTAIQRHNPSATADTLPPQEQALVLQLAQADICRLQASDASKRRGLDTSVEQLIQLAYSFESSYAEDIKRLARAIQSPKEANPNLIAEGDVVLGHLYRRSARTGFNAPLGQSLPPDAPVLLDPDDSDVEDDNLRVRWQKNRDYTFYSYELWLDTTPEVHRTREGLIFTSTPFAINEANASQSERVTSAKLVFRSYGTNSNFDTTAFMTFVEEFGQSITSFSVGGLEPETDYYFRLYVVNLNYESRASNVMHMRTKALRCRFEPLTKGSSITGAPGTVVTVNFDQTRASFTAQHTLHVGEKTVVATINPLNAHQVTFPLPTFLQKLSARNLVVKSPNGLIDVRKEVVRVT